MHGRTCLLGFALFTLVPACAEPPAPPVTKELSTSSDAFDAADTGTIRGQVVWQGQVPTATEHVIRAIAFNPRLHLNPARYPTPHIPRVNDRNHGVENAVVFLRGIDPRRSRPWDHPPVRVEFHERLLHVIQGDHRSQVGFVRRGDSIKVINRDAEFHNLHARGSCFFALPLVEANRVHERKLSHAGLVELSCGAGYYWQHAHLFVAEHPYYARTDADGRFTLDHVPVGTYEVVCWLPSWRIARKEVDPETGVTARQVWEQSKELTQSLRVQAGVIRELTYSYSD